LLFTDDAVSGVYFTVVESSGPLAAAGAMAARGAMAATGAGGVFLNVAMAQIITTPATYRVTKAQLAEDSCEDLGLLEESDLDEGDPAVDTGAVSEDLSGNTTGTDPDSSTGSEASSSPQRHNHRRQATATGGKPPTGDTVPATGDTVPATGGKRGKPDILYDNGYFFIKNHEKDLKMHVHDRWLVDPPVGIGLPTKGTKGGKNAGSKTCTPSTVGEERATPVRTLLFLKAWMLWRARIQPGWIESDDSRQRLFTEEADLVLAAVKRLQPQEDGLLGNALGSKLMRECVPDIVANI
jgi:hypothetical protein